LNSLDTTILIWLNGLSGNVKIFDDLVRVIASDYLMPLIFALSLLTLWFSGRTLSERIKYQQAAIVGSCGIGLTNVVVWLINITWHRPRPFLDHGDQLTLLFYPPTDPSFPANAVAVGFVAGTAVWTINRMFGWWIFALATVFGLSRVYAGVFYPVDIIGGAAVGVMVFCLTDYVRRCVEPLIVLFIRLIRGLSAA
jgi:undecaprenyl-diphosphatase